MALTTLNIAFMTGMIIVIFFVYALVHAASNRIFHLLYKIVLICIALVIPVLHYLLTLGFGARLAWYVWTIYLLVLTFSSIAGYQKARKEQQEQDDHPFS